MSVDREDEDPISTAMTSRPGRDARKLMLVLLRQAAEGLAPEMSVTVDEAYDSVKQLWTRGYVDLECLDELDELGRIGVRIVPAIFRTGFGSTLGRKVAQA